MIFFKFPTIIIDLEFFILTNTIKIDIQTYLEADVLRIKKISYEDARDEFNDFNKNIIKTYGYILKLNI